MGSPSIPPFQESVYSTASSEDQEGSRGIERWMRCPTPPISDKFAEYSWSEKAPQGVLVQEPARVRQARVKGKITAIESVISSRC